MGVALPRFVADFSLGRAPLALVLLVSAVVIAPGEGAAGQALPLLLAPLVPGALGGLEVELGVDAAESLLLLARVPGVLLLLALALKLACGAREKGQAEGLIRY